MPKKKKPKMTKAEVKAMKETKKKLAIIKAMEDKMDREHKMTTANLPKVINKHYPSMKEATLSKMKTDLKVMHQVSNRIFDLKNHTIQSLKQDIEFAEEAYMLQSRSHMGHIDHLIELLQARLTTLTESYSKERELLINKVKFLERKLKEEFENEDEVLKVAALIGCTTQKEKEAEDTGEFTLKYDELNEKLQINQDKMEGTYESLLKKMWISLQNFFVEYQQKTQDRRQAYYALLKIDEENSKCIRFQNNWILSMTDQVRQLKDQLKKCKQRYETEIGDLKAEKEQYTSFYKQLIDKLKFEEIADFKQLQVLVSHSNETENKLKKIVYKAERILNLAQMCRALETQEEKIGLPQQADPKSNDFKLSEKITNNLNVKDSTIFQDEWLLLNSKEMENFWKRVAVANLHRGALGLEKDILVKENVMLKEKLKAVLSLLGRQSTQKHNIGKIEIIQLQPANKPINKIKQERNTRMVIPKIVLTGP